MNSMAETQELREALAQAERDALALAHESHREAEELADEIQEAGDRIDELCAGVALAVEELNGAADYCDEAGESISNWGSYASDYFQEKWDLVGDISSFEQRATTLGEMADELKRLL